MDGRNKIPMRIIEELDNGDTVTTYYDVVILNNQYYYVYNNVSTGPYEEFDDAVQAAVSDLIPQTVTDGR